MDGVAWASDATSVGYGGLAITLSDSATLIVLASPTVASCGATTSAWATGGSDGTAAAWIYKL